LYRKDLRKYLHLYLHLPGRQTTINHNSTVSFLQEISACTNLANLIRFSSAADRLIPENRKHPPGFRRLPFLTDAEDVRHVLRPL